MGGMGEFDGGEGSVFVPSNITHSKDCILHYSCKGECTCDFQQRVKDAQPILVLISEFNSLKAENAKAKEVLGRINECLPSNPDMSINAMWATVRRIAGIIRTSKLLEDGDGA